MSVWIKVEERLPDYDGTYWVVRKDVKRPTIEDFFKCKSGAVWDRDDESVRIDFSSWTIVPRLKESNPVTHWQPLPDAPKGVSDD